MRKKIVSTFLCSLMLFNTIPVMANSEVSTESTEFFQNSGSTTATSTATIPKTDSISNSASKNKLKVSNSKKSDSKKKSKVNKKKSSKDKKEEKSYTTSNGFTVIKTPEKKVVVQTKKSTKKIKKLSEEKISINQKIKKENNKIKQLSFRINKIKEFYTNWKWKSMIGIDSDNVLTNIEADQLVKDLQNDIQNPILSNTVKGYHFGIQEQKNLLAVADDSLLSVDLNPLLLQLQTSYQKQLETEQYKLKQYKLKKQTIVHSITLIENQKAVVFDPMDLLIKSNLTKDMAQKVLKGTALEECSDYFIECEQKYEVNAVAIMAIAIHESGWGTSRRAIEDNNLTGYGVFSDSAKGINANTKEENLLMTAKLLKEKYLTKGGAYYHDGKSLMKINESYCTSSDWAINVTKYAYTLMEQLK